MTTTDTTPHGEEEQATETSNEVTEANVTEEAAEIKQETDWKAEARKWEARAKENVELAKKWKEHEDSFKTEEQKRIEELEAFKREAEAQKLEAYKYKLASEKGLNAAALQLLDGNTEEELVSKADAIVALLSVNDTNNSPKPVSTQGKGNTIEEGDVDTLKAFFQENLFNN